MPALRWERVRRPRGGTVRVPVRRTLHGGYGPATVAQLHALKARGILAMPGLTLAQASDLLRRTAGR